MITLKELYKLYNMVDAKIYINGELKTYEETLGYETLMDYPVRRIRPMCESKGQLSLSGGISVEPYLEIHLNKKD